ncbi:MAG: metallophosphoesterase [Candidatus Aminicenantes bacterium]|nr:metallophosphoesterase [Candidatus Aminicenantes bacterium]
MMKRAIWLSDIHLDHLPPPESALFLESIKKLSGTAIWISGDIGQADTIVEFLAQMESTLELPIYFVLGNHDYYLSSINNVRSRVQKAFDNSRRLCWLSDSDVKEISPDVGLLGHDSWADGRLGEYEASDLLLNDYILIRDFNPFLQRSETVGPSSPLGPNDLMDLICGKQTKQNRLLIMQALADEAVEYIERRLPAALQKYKHVYFLTHVPPFKEACWHQGRISDDNSLPHFSAKVVGETLVRIMEKHPDRQLTVLCGHTHSGGVAQVLSNLVVYTAQAVYGNPDIQKIFSFED